ncbi:DUF2169 family type VI secretion system accessory protein [Massilia sp. DWR3-1-1]|uniref:DUF2169 family type VI secretion system accessory protein n=1 Tax=Massilia sp. DWR3-1-1 TaxID=2804559 RepID=UPI003CEA424E
MLSAEMKTVNAATSHLDGVAVNASTGAERAHAPHFSIPNLVFENRTRLDAAQFDMVDQYGSSFHVVVAKTAYSLGAHDATGMAPLIALSPAAKLNVEDLHFDDDSNASVRHESDFAPYKPACDVIVNATAHAPRGKPTSAFRVRLAVQPAPPEPSEGATGHATPPKSARAPLIDKTLSITGERNFKKKIALLRLLQWGVKVVTFGVLRPNPWRLALADDTAQIPLRYEFANGGQCRIDEDDGAAKRVPTNARLPRDEAATNNAYANVARPVAHESSDANPLGRGFTRRWYLDASDIKTMAAPRISAEWRPCTALQFWRAAHGEALPDPVGLGIVGRGWLPRRALAGTFDANATYANDDVPNLPEDFDFAYYNCAPRDQQCPYLRGEESFTLLNLCRPDHPSATSDANGNAVLRFSLPMQALFLLAVDGCDDLMIERMVIDTVIVEPDEGRVELTWRALLPTDCDLRVARLMQVTEAAQIARVRQLEQLQASQIAAHAKAAAQGPAR